MKKLTCYICGSELEVAAITTEEEYLVFCPACQNRHLMVKEFLLKQLKDLEHICFIHNIKPYTMKG
jgi:DNA-directed RNA polymerase subunit RPC12/RpoP